jgi:hypothetical protein
MLSNFELERLRTLDRLLSVGHETVDDLLSQAITVANMIDPQPTDKVNIGPLERLISENINLNNRLEKLSLDLQSLRMNQSNKYNQPYTSDIQWSGPGTYTGTSWPSNPGLYPSSSTSGASFTALTVEDIKRMTTEAQTKSAQQIAEKFAQQEQTNLTDQIREQLRNLTTDMKNK